MNFWILCNLALFNMWISCWCVGEKYRMLKVWPMKQRPHYSFIWLKWIWRQYLMECTFISLQVPVRDLSGVVLMSTTETETHIRAIEYAKSIKLLRCTNCDQVFAQITLGLRCRQIEKSLICNWDQTQTISDQSPSSLYISCV